MFFDRISAVISVMVAAPFSIERPLAKEMSKSFTSRDFLSKVFCSKKLSIN